MPPPSTNSVATVSGAFSAQPLARAPRQIASVWVRRQLAGEGRTAPRLGRGRRRDLCALAKPAAPSPFETLASTEGNPGIL